MQLSAINIKYLILIALLTFPYNNFPYTSSGTLKPLCILVLPIILLPIVYNKLIQNGFSINKSMLYLIALISTYCAMTLYHVVFDETGTLKLLSPYVRYYQFLFYSLVTLLCFCFGHIARNAIGFRNTIKYFVISFIPSICTGLLQIAFNNSELTQTLRKIFASTVYPNGYYRVHMLTTEPSWASFDICTYLIPCTWFLIVSTKNKIPVYYLALLCSEVMVLLYTKSALGIIMFVMSVITILIFEIKKSKRYIMPALGSLFVLMCVFIFIKTNSDSYLRFTNLGESISNRESVEESAATRLISYYVGYNIIKDNYLTGVGFRMAGYHYPRFIEPEMELFPLVQDWVDPYSNRFPDIKSFLIDVVASSGVIGAILLILFFMHVLKHLKSTDIGKNERYLLQIIFILSIAGSFSLNIYGYPPFWFFCGIISSFET